MTICISAVGARYPFPRESTGTYGIRILRPKSEPLVRLEDTGYLTRGSLSVSLPRADNMSKGSFFGEAVLKKATIELRLVSPIWLAQHVQWGWRG